MEPTSNWNSTVIAIISLVIAMVSAYFARRSTIASERSAQAAEESARSARDSASSARGMELTSRGQYLLNLTEDAIKIFKHGGERAIDKYLKNRTDLTDEEKENIRKDSMGGRHS